MATTTMANPPVDSNPAENLKLQISRVIRASRQRTFDAWTRPDYIRQWFGGSRTLAEVETDPREGGAYLIKANASTTEPDMNRDASISGRYVKVQPYDLLSFTWVGDWNPTEETLVTITFKDVTEGTEVTVIHERFATELSRSKHEQGWTNSTNKLKSFLESTS
ncbi:MAG TPA: SRPBCC domain-containing protein [Edaphobacter sp.]